MWTPDAPPPSAVNASRDVRERCTAVANEVLERTGDTALAIEAASKELGRARRRYRLTSRSTSRVLGGDR